MIFMPSNSLWLEEDVPKYDDFEGEATTDVAIVGGGITGLQCAYLLKKAGLKVIVIEANRICRETSGHTTAKITSNQNLIYTDLYNKWGMETAQKYAESSQNAIEQIYSLTQELNINCDFFRQENHIYTLEDDGISKLEDELKIVHSIARNRLHE
jgi:glycine/D-amino acid oxidase-like deaminating enzyme